MTEKAYFGGGCFWCTEAVFKMLKGIESVEPGYAGGSDEQPSYRQIGDHAEVVKIEFDPNVITYQDLLTVFFATHDPTTPNRQGADVGSQYRSVILTTSAAQGTAANQMIESINDSTELGEPIVTEVKPLTRFYPAEPEHQNYYAQNQNAPYCQVVINPKLEKVKAKFTSLLEDL